VGTVPQAELRLAQGHKSPHAPRTPTRVVTYGSPTGTNHHTNPHPNPRGDLRLTHGHKSPHAILPGAGGRDPVRRDHRTGTTSGQAVPGNREPYPRQLMTRAFPA
jgi:hypothetical protein